jgi:hypothetical protein
MVPIPALLALAVILLAEIWRSCFAPRLGPVLQDGGQWSDGVGELRSDKDGERRVEVLLLLHFASKPSNPKPVTE